MVWLKMQVVSTSKRLFAFGIDIGAEVVLVWRLVRRESSIAIKAIGTVLYLHMGNLRVECHNPLYGLLHTPFELSSYGLVFFFMRLKPLTVVVGHHLAQETQYSLLIHRLFIILPHQSALLLWNKHLVALLDAEGLIPSVDHRQGSHHTDAVG